MCDTAPTAKALFLKNAKKSSDWSVWAKAMDSWIWNSSKGSSMLAWLSKVSGRRSTGTKGAAWGSSAIICSKGLTKMIRRSGISMMTHASVSSRVKGFRAASQIPSPETLLLPKLWGGDPQSDLIWPIGLPPKAGSHFFQYLIQDAVLIVWIFRLHLPLRVKSP